MRWLLGATATVVLCSLCPAWGGGQSYSTDQDWWHGDLRLNQPLTLQCTHQTIKSILATISGETQVPLSAHERVSNWRLTIVVHGKAAYETLDLIAKRNQATVSVTNEREWGLKIERKDVLLTGPDYGQEFTYVYIRIRPGGGRREPVPGVEGLSRILWNIESNFHLYRPDGSKLSYGAYF